MNTDTTKSNRTLIYDLPFFMFTYSLLNPPISFTLRTEIIDTVFLSISEQIDIAQSGTVNIAFLSDDEIQELNRNYRGIDKTTDVLSFHYFEDFE